MKRSTLFLVLLLCGCSRGDDDDAKTAADAKTGAPAGTTVRAPVYPEPEAVQVLRVFDSARIATARAVRERSQNESILEYARVMLADHRAITRVLDSLLTSTNQSAAENQTTQQIRTAGLDLANRLVTIDTGVNNTYLQGEIDDHMRALNLLDTAVIPSARTAGIKDALTQLRPAYEAHLQRAQAIMEARRAAAAGRASTPATPRPAPAPAALPPVDTVRVDTLPIRR